MPMPEVGSSSISSLGLEQIDMPTSSTRCWPWEQLAGQGVGAGAELQAFEYLVGHLQVFAFAIDPAPEVQGAPGAVAALGGQAQVFRRTLEVLEQAGELERDAPMPRPTRAWAGLRIRLLPSK